MDESSADDSFKFESKTSLVYKMSTHLCQTIVWLQSGQLYRLDLVEFGPNVPYIYKERKLRQRIHQIIRPICL